jgi:hypothetical protein
VATSAAEPRDAPSSVVAIRRGLLALAAGGTIGVALELLLLRHWTEARELIAWVAVAVLGVAVSLAIRRPTRRTILVARGLGVVVLVTSAIGVFVHVWVNYEAAPLDARYTTSWPTTSEPVRWLLAATDTVGPSPSLAPLALAFVALVLLLALVQHPALEADAPAG